MNAEGNRKYTHYWGDTAGKLPVTLSIMRPLGVGEFIRKSLESFSFAQKIVEDGEFGGSARRVTDPYLSHAWVNIAVGLLMRNIGRADFRIKRNGEFVSSGPVCDLFREATPGMSRFDLWKQTSAWWFLEGEAFWYYGERYGGGIPEEIQILNPRRMRHWVERDKVRRWYYATDWGMVPILPDEIIHFKEWNPWNPHRGINPLIPLSLEIEQDFHANRANTDLLRNDAIPQGLLKTDQTLRPDEADQLEERWERKYGRNGRRRKVAVLGKGTEFQNLSFSPEVVKFFELKRWNLYTILAKYGIPPRVANVQDRQAPLSGKDTEEQHAAFWKYTIVPVLKNFEQILEAQFFVRFALKERGVFDLSAIPELQESEDAQSKRDVAEIQSGLKTINEVLAARGEETKRWGDIWYRPKNLIPTTGDEKTPTKDNTRSMRS